MCSYKIYSLGRSLW